ncbi:MAG: MFS transporter [Acidobacteria bacterium]|nr:MFS transporter [Acidobacteriota bacterium]
MSTYLKTRLALMMFIQYVIWGAWYVTITTYLTQTLHFTGTQAGLVFSTVSIASLVSPFFVGLVADRFFATERVMAFLYVLSAVLVYGVTKVTTFPAVFGLMLAFCLCYFPTVALTNSITMQSLKDPGRDFPPIRTLGTLGFIVVVSVVSLFKWEADAMQFTLAAIAAVVMAIYSIAVLPHTPPPARGQQVTWQRAIGLDTLGMMKQSSFAVFIVASILACIPLTFYYSFANAYLNDLQVNNAGFMMTLGQWAELVMLLAMPLMFRYVSIRGVLLIGLASWALRYVLLAYGNPDAGIWMFYLAILLHGACYDFFFVAGQLYTDQEAPGHLRSSAQGFITFVTYGIGMYIGSVLSGVARDYFPTWQSFWLSSAIMSAAIMLLVLLFFRTTSMIRAKEKGLPETEPATIPGA